jgi:chemotaxis protein CheC
LSIYEESALQELANISAGGYLVALSELIGCTIVFSPPSIATDMLGAVLEELLIPLAEDADEILMMCTDFIVDNEKVCGYFLFMPDIISMKKIFRLLEE